MSAQSDLPIELMRHFVHREQEHWPEFVGALVVGSVAHGEARPDSDVDCVLVFDPLDEAIVPAEFVWVPGTDTYHTIFQIEASEVGGILAASETVTVAPGATTTVTILLLAADATPNIIVNPPGGGSGQPVDPDGNDGGGDPGDGGSTDDGSYDGGTSGGGNGSGSAPFTSLPSTGTGEVTPASAMFVLIGGLADRHGWWSGIARVSPVGHLE